MNPLPTSLDSTLLTVVLATLAIGMPILTILAIRFFWDRSLYLGRSKELEKMIWQLHRIASAMEHQLNVSFPPVQPGTEDATDIAFLEKPAAPAKRVSTPAPAPAPAQPRAATPAPVAPLAATSAPAPQNRVPAATAPSAAVPPPPQPEAAPPQPAAAQPQSGTEQPAEPEGFKPLVPRDPKDPPRQGGVNSMFGF